MISQEKIVVLVRQPALPHYRQAVFRELCDREKLECKVVYGVSPVISNSAPHHYSAQMLKMRTVNMPLVGKVMIDLKFWLLILKSRPHVVVFSWNARQLDLFFLILMTKSLGIGSVVWGHGYSKNDSVFRSGLRNLLAKCSDSVLCYSETIAITIRDKLINKSKVFVAQNALDQKENFTYYEHYKKNPSFAKKIAEGFGITNELRWVVAVSRLSRANRFDLIIEAASHIKQMGVIIVGAGKDEVAYLTDHARKIGVSQRVKFTGALYDSAKVGALLSRSSVFCYPANMGLSLHHAFGFGLPVVTGNDINSHGPEVEALIDGVNGKYFEHNNVIDLVRTLELLLFNEALLTEMGTAAKKTVERTFTVNNMIDGMESAIVYAHKRRAK